MSLTAIVEALVSAGASPDMILAAVRAAEAGQEQRLAAKRENNADRQRRHRNAVSRNVTPVTPVTRDECDAPAPFLPSDKETSPTPPKENNSPLTPAPGEAAPARQRFQNPAVVLQSVLDPMTAKSWADHLAQKGKQLSGPAAEATVAELMKIRANGGNPVEAVNLSIRKNWASVDIDYCRNAGMKFTTAAPDKADTIDWAPALAGFIADGFWPPSLGPKPGEPGCKAPAAAIEQAKAAA